jgi:ribosome-associated translation inhibitor RaiA
MLVQFNSDRHIEGNATLAEQSETAVRGALGSFADQITRIEIHVSDENGAEKGGVNDKSCRIEARLSGRPPIAVHAVADTVVKSVDGAADKLRNAVETIIGRSNQH